MKTVALDVRPRVEAASEFAQAWKGGRGSRADRISLASSELLWKVLKAKRWGLLTALCGATSKAVHSDLSVLLAAGVLTRTESGQVEFPYEAVKVECLLQAA